MSHQQFDLLLPSGKSVRMQQPDLIELLINGEIPDALTGMVEQMIQRTLVANGMATADERAQLDNGEANDSGRALQFMRFIIRTVTLDPIICDDLGDMRALKAQGKNVAFMGTFDQVDLFTIYGGALGVAEKLVAMFHREDSPTDAVQNLPGSAEDAPASLDAAERADGPTVVGVPGEHGDHPLGDVRGGEPGGVGRDAEAAEVDGGATPQPVRRRRSSRRK